MVMEARFLLQMPACLRQQILAQQSAFKLRNTGEHFLHQHCSSFRTFASKAKPVARGKALPSKPPPQSFAPSRAPTGNLATPSSPQSRAFIDTFEPLSERVLLYASPSHGSFFAASYLIGGFLLFGGYSYAQMFLKDRPGLQTPWLLKGIGAFTTVCVVAFGTSFILAPRSMIKSISIASTKAADNATMRAPRVLRIEVKRALPFLKPDVLEVSPRKVTLDRNLPIAVEDLNVYDVPLRETQSFTQQYFTAAATKSKGVGAAFSSFNRSLLVAWPAIKRDTRRMFLRDQMAYVQVDGNGTFKLDLQNCYILDSGNPLHRIITANPSARPNIWSWMSRLFSKD